VSDLKRSHGYYAGKSRALKQRERIPITRQIAEFKEGDAVRIKINSRVRGGKISLRYNGRIAKVVGRQGSAYKVLLKDVSKPKQFVVSALHLQKA